MNKVDSICFILIGILLIFLSIFHNIQVNKLMNDNSNLKDQNEVLQKQNYDLYKIIYDYNCKENNIEEIIIK